MEIEIKKTRNHKGALKVAEASRRYFETGFEDLKRDLQKHMLYGAYDNNNMIGFVTYEEDNKDVIEVSWLAVMPKHRDKGIGGKLIKDTLKMLKGKYKICKVKTLAETHKDSGYAKTRKFYRKLGFNSLEIIHPYPGWDKDSPCQIFVKFLK